MIFNQTNLNKGDVINCGVPMLVSQYLGVTKDDHAKWPWKAHLIDKRGVKVQLGRYPTELLAAKAYNEGVRVRNLDLPLNPV